MDTEEKMVALTEEHLDALRTTLKETVRAELMEIFGVHMVTDRQDDPLHASVLRYLSRVAKVHEGVEMKNAVDAALTNAFDVYSKVNDLNRELIRKESRDVCRVYWQDVLNSWVLKQKLQEVVQNLPI